MVVCWLFVAVVLCVYCFLVFVLSHVRLHRDLYFAYIIFYKLLVFINANAPPFYYLLPPWDPLSMCSGVFFSLGSSYFFSLFFLCILRFIR